MVRNISRARQRKPLGKPFRKEDRCRTTVKNVRGRVHLLSALRLPTLLCTERKLQLHTLAGAPIVRDENRKSAWKNKNPAMSQAIERAELGYLVPILRWAHRSPVHRK